MAASTTPMTRGSSRDPFQPAHTDRAPASARARLAARDDRPAVGLGDRRADDHGPNRPCPVDGAADPLDAADAGAHAGDEGDPAEVQGGQEAPAGRADEVLPGEPDQPGCVLPAAGVADPGLLRALFRAPRVLEAPAAGLALVAAHRPEHRRPRQLALVGLPAPGYL